MNADERVEAAREATEQAPPEEGGDVPDVTPPIVAEGEGQAPPGGDVAERFHQYLKDKDISRSARGKYDDDVVPLIATATGLRESDIYPAGTGSAKAYNMLNRMSQGRALKRRFPLALIMLKDPAAVGDGLRYAKRVVGAKFDAVALATPAGGTWEIAAAVEAPGGTITPRLQDHFPGMKIEQPLGAGAGAGPTIGTLPVQVEVDDRTERMLRIAIATYPAVLLVGPPGTGKTTLAENLFERIVRDPSRYGFSTVPKGLKIRTPDEGWTARDLVGGETVDEENRLRFRPGLILDAIREDHWVLLDEANRADMDKIFGPLLTWLSMKSVELGRATTAVNSPVVELGWHDEPGSDTRNADKLAAKDPGTEAIKYLAGSEWRLIATYNPVDAQRVFRFGQALARRFKTIPVPAPEPPTFSEILDPLVEDLPEPCQRRIEALYRAHWKEESTRLGPAIFFEMADYIRGAIDLGELDGRPPSAESGQSSATEDGGAQPQDPELPLGESVPVETATGVEDEADLDGSGSPNPPAGRPVTLGTASAVEVEQIIAEAYLTAAGKYLTRIDPRVRSLLGERITNEGGLVEAQWTWIKDLLPAMG